MAQKKKKKNSIICLSIKIYGRLNSIFLRNYQVYYNHLNRMKIGCISKASLIVYPYPITVQAMHLVTE